MTRLFFSVPTTTLMVASSISSMVMALWFFRAARRAASFKRFSRSAPVKPGGRLGYGGEHHVGRQGLSFGVDTQDFLPALDIG